jgi:hypothetical protein
MRSFRNFLTEMPYVEYDGGHRVFDVELERYASSPDKFLKFIDGILSGDKHTDKYDNTIELRDQQDKNDFAHFLRNDDFLATWLDDNPGVKTKLEAIYKKHSIG